MRIIGGAFRRRQLASPPDGTPTRPMPDHVREAIYNLLRGHFEGETVYDGFSGTGSVGLEAVSRGASRVVLVEKDKRVAGVLRENIETLGVGERCEVVVGDALGAGALARCPDPVHVVFFDPPYAMTRDAGSWRRVCAQFSKLVGRLDETGYAVLRTPWPAVREVGAEREHESLELTIEGAVGPETHAYGTTAVHLYMRDRGE